jgi:hypothetical protein
MTEPRTEQLPVHRAYVASTRRGVPTRAYCQCGWSVVGPRWNVARRATQHERRGDL